MLSMAALAVATAQPMAPASPPPFEVAVQRIDAFVEAERQAAGIPGVAVAIVQTDGARHVRGFGHDGNGAPIDADTPFPIGSLTKSFTALLARQAIDAGQIDVDAPVQRYLPGFRVADVDASARITLRHLLNQTSGFARAAGMAPLLQQRGATVGELVRGLATLELASAPGERFEYSNLNFVVLGAVLEAVTGRPWPTLVQERIFMPLAMTHSHADPAAARLAGMTALHRIWFGAPVRQPLRIAPGLVPAGGLVASAADMAAYLRMLLGAGVGPGGPVLSAPAVRQLLEPASPPARSRLLAADFEFRYGEGWFVGPFGAAADARWHLGNLASFVAWMVLLPETRQAVLVLVNANSELPFGEVNAVMSRLPIGVVNLLRGHPAPRGPGLREAYRPFNAAVALSTVAIAALAWRARRARRSLWAWLMALLAALLLAALQAAGLGPAMLAAFAPDLAATLAVVGALLCMPAVARALAHCRRARGRAGHR